ncbi:MAG TPA: glycosyltransferase [Pseudonocardiaceae bacterium]|nr:glycosyltransferase [Pseudonocardiaceae bacterium]
MRYVMWTPLPPERSGISDYSYELLGPLAETVDLRVAIREPGVEAPQGVATVDAATATADLNLYQMGNHAGVHSWIYQRALDEPGVVVLHDTSLLDFHHAYLDGANSAAFRQEVEYAHGPIWGDQDDAALLGGWPSIEVDGVRQLDAGTLSMERRLVSASRGVIVHDPFAASWLRARYPGVPVFVVSSGAPVRDDTGRVGTRARFGWHDEHVVFGIFGGIHRIKRILPAVLAFGQVRRRWPQARLLIAGHVDQRDVHTDVLRAIEQFGLTESVHIVPGPPKAEFEDLITATDAVINLRWPTAGETSATMMRAFGAGRLVITSDLPQHRHYDPAFCWRVPTEGGIHEATTLIRLLEHAVAEPDDVRSAGKLARDYVAGHASWPVVAAGYRAALESVGTTRPTSVWHSPELRGVNLFADFRATTGLAESARRHAIALRRTGVDLTYTEFNTRAANRSLAVPGELADLRGGKDHPIDLWMVNLNEFQLINDHALDRYTIALWAWELPGILDRTLAQLARIDELWVLSSFVADAFRTATDKPITVIPSVVPPLSATPDRARFGLAEDALVVLFTFSASSSDARKNPWGVIEAFRRTFGPGERGTSAHLVIKVNDLDRFPELASHLADAMTDVRGTLIAGDLTRPEMDTLLASCDVYASLHRSEGFGLGMAEAMTLGKAVVATGFGGNTDFMPPGSAAVVGYDVRPITAADHRFGPQFGDWYQPGQLWAEPDVGQAARWLRWLADNPAARARMGARGAEAIQAWSGYQAVGATMRRRLAEIDPRR